MRIQNYAFCKIVAISEANQSEPFLETQVLRQQWLNDQEVSEKERMGRHIALERISNCVNASSDKLDLSGLALTALFPGMFQGCSSVQTLVLDFNQLTDLSEAHFFGLCELTMLTVNNNALSRVEPSTFKSLPKLEWLMVDDNQLDPSFLKSLSGLESLKGLSASNNKVSSLDCELGQWCTHLKKLHLANNGLLVLEEKALSLLSNLESIDLSSNPITELDGEMFSSMPHLRRLDLCGTRLKSIQNLEAVQSHCFIDFRHTPLDPDTVSRLARLCAMPGRNRGVSCDFAFLESDRTWLDTPGLSESERIERTKMLYQIRTASLQGSSYLDLSRIRVSSLLPGMFAACPRLVELYLEDSNISKIPAGTFKGLSNLKLLDLSYNRLEQLTPGTFLGLTALTKLRLSNNQIQSVHSLTFLRVPLLVRLDLKGNQIQYFDQQKLLGFLTQDCKVALCDNPIKDIQLSNPMGFSHSYLPTAPLPIPSPPPSKIESLMSVVRESRLPTLDLSGMGLTQLPDFRDQKLGHVTTLILSRNKLDTLPDHAFIGLPNLTQIILNDNSIRYVSQRAFEGLSHLKILGVHSNKIQEFSPGTFESLKSLEVLELSSNELTQVLQLKGLVALKRVSLWGNRISGGVLTSCFNGCSSLRVLDLSDNDITNLSKKEYEFLQKIAEVDLSGNKISEIPLPSVTRWPETCSLDLSDNPLNPKCVGGLKKFQNPTVLFSPLYTKDVHDWIHSDAADRQSRSNRMLVYQNVTEAALTNRLSLSGLGLTSVPTFLFENLLNLRVLNLSNNVLTTLPEVLRKLPNLEKLNLADNGIVELPQGAFTSQSSLKELNMSGNNIRSVCEGALRGLTSLEVVIFSRNALSKMPMQVFYDTPKLTRLDLAGNLLIPSDPALESLSRRIPWVNLEDTYSLTDPDSLSLYPENSAVLKAAKLPPNTVSTVRDPGFQFRLCELSEGKADTKHLTELEQIEFAKRVQSGRNVSSTFFTSKVQMFHTTLGFSRLGGKSLHFVWDAQSGDLWLHMVGRHYLDSTTQYSIDWASPYFMDSATRLEMLSQDPWQRDILSLAPSSSITTQTRSRR